MLVQKSEIKSENFGYMQILKFINIMSSCYSFGTNNQQISYLKHFIDLKCYESLDFLLSRAKNQFIFFCLELQHSFKFVLEYWQNFIKVMNRNNLKSEF